MAILMLDIQEPITRAQDGRMNIPLFDLRNGRSYMGDGKGEDAFFGLYGSRSHSVQFTILTFSVAYRLGAWVTECWVGLRNSGCGISAVRDPPVRAGQEN